MIPNAWSGLRGLPAVPEPGGLINRTFLVGNPPIAVVQRVNPIFGPLVHEDIEAVTEHLAEKGIVTPRLIRTEEGALYHQDSEGGIWRAMTFVPGVCLHRVDGPARAEAAGALVARFHAALSDFTYGYQHVRLGVHDTHLHMQRLSSSCNSSLPEAYALSQEILADWHTQKGPPETEEIHAHGDLKLSNLRFSEDGAGICLLDLDTLGRMPIEVELGDAFRSWCNPVGEDSLETWFDRSIFDAALKGYRQVRALETDQEELLLWGVERISLELASRFCRDVWEDCYFGWNPERFESRREHNLYRAKGQYRLSRSVHLARLGG